MTKENKTLDFEQAFARLEEILEKMNSGNLPLNDSLKLYEEADLLINNCAGRLQAAEQKIETLVKNRGGEIALGANQKPLTQEFSIENTGLNYATTNGEQRG